MCIYSSDMLLQLYAMSGPSKNRLIDARRRRGRAARPKTSQGLIVKPRAQVKGPNIFSLCTCRDTIFQYDVLIHITQIMSFVCKQTIRTVFSINNSGK